MAQVVRNPSTTSVVRDEGERKFFSNIFIMMAIGLATTALLSLVVSSTPQLLALLVSASGTPTPLWFGLMIAELVMVFVIAGYARKTGVTIMSGLSLFALYAAMNGLTIAPIIHVYTAGSVAKAFAVSAATFGTCALWGYTTKRDLRPLGAFFLVGLIGLIIATVVNIFLQSSALDFALSAIGVLLFAGITAFDMQVLKSDYRESGGGTGAIVNGALMLYLDFLNMFLYILKFLGERATD